MDFGWLVAWFSIGRMVISTPLGILTDKYRHRTSLILDSSVMLMGAVLWANCQFFIGLPMLYLAQFLLGVGSGSLGVLRSYVVEQTPPESRTYMMARLSALQYAGFCVTPLAGALLSSIGKNISYFLKYTFPSLLVLLLAALCVIFLIYPFKDFETVEADDIKETEIGPLLSSQKVDQCIEYHTFLEEEKTEVDTKLSKPSIDFFSLPSASIKDITNTTIYNQNMANDQVDISRVYILLMLMNFTTRGAIAVYETQSSQILLKDFNLSELHLGFIVTFAGILGTFQFLLFKSFWLTYFTDIQLMSGGIFAMAISQLLIINSPINSTSLWRFLVPFFLMYSIAYPVSNSAVRKLCIYEYFA